MAEHTSISWADATFNPWVGCTKVSPACDGCYAEALMDTRLGRVEWGGERVRTSKAYWRQPLKWDRDAAAAGKPVFVFCASLADVFDNQVDIQWQRDLFRLIFQTPHLTWLLLTKRPGNIMAFVRQQLGEDAPPETTAWCWPRNAAIGCTVVAQEEADRDIPKLLAAKAAVNPAFAFVSLEPLLEPVDLTRLRNPLWATGQQFDSLTGAGNPSLWSAVYSEIRGQKLDWVIAGGETDQGAHKARPSHPDWFRSLRDQCAAARVTFHFKQWGEWCPSNLGTEINLANVDIDGGWEFSAGVHGVRQALVARVGKRAAGRALDGVIHDARPTLAYVGSPTHG